MDKVQLIISTILSLVIVTSENYGQNFVDFINPFPEIAKTDDVLSITSNKNEDFLNRPEVSFSLYNSNLFNYTEKPFYYELNDRKVYITYIAEQDNEGVEYLEYDDDGNEVASGRFNAKIVAIGKIDLLQGSGFNTFVVAIRHLDVVYVHLYNFSSSGEFLSAVRLFEAQATRQKIYFDHPLYDFQIESDGTIYQEYDGLDFYRERKYELHQDGHFKVIWENVVNR